VYDLSPGKTRRRRADPNIERIAGDRIMAEHATELTSVVAAALVAVAASNASTGEGIAATRLCGRHPRQLDSTGHQRRSDMAVSGTHPISEQLS
jgi:hypothetical protein